MSGASPYMREEQERRTRLDIEEIRNLQDALRRKVHTIELKLEGAETDDEEFQELHDRVDMLEQDVKKIRADVEAIKKELAEQGQQGNEDEDDDEELI